MDAQQGPRGEGSTSQTELLLHPPPTSEMLSALSLAFPVSVGGIFPVAGTKPKSHLGLLSCLYPLSDLSANPVFSTFKS